jgi:hypothetical protein
VSVPADVKKDKPALRRQMPARDSGERLKDFGKWKPA